jgi:SAM dependent carboxyl methyltransferase
MPERGREDHPHARQSVMLSQGRYDDHALTQRRAGAVGLPLLTRAGQAISLPSDGRALVMVDYGSATGRNSADPVRTIIEVVRRRAAALPIVVFHNDQPANDFSSLFAWLESPQGYPHAAEGVFAYGSGRSFYGRVFPDEYVDIGWSANAGHWLSRVPETIPDHICYRRGASGLDEPFSRQATEDWTRFVEHRAHELRVGGRMVVSIVSVDDHGSSGGDHFLDVVNEALLELMQADRLRRDEYTRMAIATYIRTVDDLEAPFRDGPSSRALVLEEHAVTVVSDPLGDRYDATGDAVAYATAHASWLRGLSEPSLIGALDPDRTPEAAAAFANDLYASVAARLTRDPSKARCRWRISQLLLTKHESL